MKIVCDLEANTTVLVPLSSEEQAELVLRQNTPVEPEPAPTKEQLLAQLQALQAQIQALE